MMGATWSSAPSARGVVLSNMKERKKDMTASPLRGKKWISRERAQCLLKTGFDMTMHGWRLGALIYDNEFVRVYSASRADYVNGMEWVVKVSDTADIVHEATIRWKLVQNASPRAAACFPAIPPAPLPHTFVERSGIAGFIMERCDVALVEGVVYDVSTVAAIGFRVLDALEALHTTCFVGHNDLAVLNIGARRGIARDAVLLDLGMTRAFSSVTNGGVHHMGPARALYSSVAQHCWAFAHPLSDVESLAYLLAMLLRGNLPWSGLPLLVADGDDDDTAYREVPGDPVVRMKRDVLQGRAALHDSPFLTRFIEELCIQRAACGLNDARWNHGLYGSSGDEDPIMSATTVNYAAFRSVCNTS